MVKGATLAFGGRKKARSAFKQGIWGTSGQTGLSKSPHVPCLELHPPDVFLPPNLNLLLNLYPPPHKYPTSTSFSKIPGSRHLFSSNSLRLASTRKKELSRKDHVQTISRQEGEIKTFLKNNEISSAFSNGTLI